MKEDNDEPTICPLTLQSIPNDDPTNVAVIFSSTHLTKYHFKNISTMNSTTSALNQNVGHIDREKNDAILAGSFTFDAKKCSQCTLIPLISYLQSKTESTSKCPVSHSFNISSVWDKKALQILERELQNQPLKKSAPWNIVSFRYGKQCYFLHVGKSKSDNLRKTILAQDWIAHTLGMDVGLGLKILHKGKVLHPTNSQSSEIISMTILEISKNDILCFKKPSLVVMGTRTGSELQPNPNLSDANNKNNFTYQRVGEVLANIGPNEHRDE